MRKQPTKAICRIRDGVPETPDGSIPLALVSDVKRLIESSRARVATAVNDELTGLYWQIGRRINQDILKERRAEYGQQIVSALSRELTQEFGPGFAETSLRHMVRFAEVYPDEGIVSTLRRQLSWSLLKIIIYMDDPLKREVYLEMARMERWSARALQQRVDGMLFERTAISKKPTKLIEHQLKALTEEDKLTPELVFRDPYFLDFLGLKDRFLEKDLEDAIMRQMGISRSASSLR